MQTLGLCSCWYKAAKERNLHPQSPFFVVFYFYFLTVCEFYFNGDFENIFLQMDVLGGGDGAWWWCQSICGGLKHKITNFEMLVFIKY